MLSCCAATLSTGRVILQEIGSGWSFRGEPTCRAQLLIYQYTGGSHKDLCFPRHFELFLHCFWSAVQDYSRILGGFFFRWPGMWPLPGI